MILPISSRNNETDDNVTQADVSLQATGMARQVWQIWHLLIN